LDRVPSNKAAGLVGAQICSDSFKKIETDTCVYVTVGDAPNAVVRILGSAAAEIHVINARSISAAPCARLASRGG
jgi:hypothetical protein